MGTLGLFKADVFKETLDMPTAGKLKDSFDIIEKIKTMPALESFDENDLKELLRISKIVRYEPGEIIVDESSYDGWIYYLISGRVRIVKAGEEAGQGVGYLDDGTMIVVEGGRDHIGENVRINVTSVLQTPAGRMIFARQVDENSRANV